jgi:transcriptional regulator with XRE-family HTH domain
MAELNQVLKDSIGDGLKRFRGNEGKKTFWSRYGLDPGQMGRYENKRELPNLETLYRICQILDMSASWLLFRLGSVKLSMLKNENSDSNKPRRP